MPRSRTQIAYIHVISFRYCWQRYPRADPSHATHNYSTVESDNPDAHCQIVDMRGGADGWCPSAWYPLPKESRAPTMSDQSYTLNLNSTVSRCTVTFSLTPSPPGWAWTSTWRSWTASPRTSPPRWVGCRTAKAQLPAISSTNSRRSQALRSNVSSVRVE